MKRAIPAVPESSALVDQGGRITQEYRNFLQQLANYADRIEDLETLVSLIIPPARLAQLAIDADVEPQRTNDVSLGTAALQFLNVALSGYVQSLGAYFGNIGTGVYIAYGAVDLGTWTAENTSATIIQGDGNGLKVYYDTGLTPGSTYTPTLLFSVDNTGLLKVNQATITTTMKAATVNATSAYQANGTPGEASLTVTYLTGTPGTGQSSKTVTFTQGIETAHT